jgi:hypothetical protein
MLKSLSVCVVFLLAWTGRATAQNYQYIYGTENKLAALAKQPSSARALDSVEEALDIGDGTNVSKLLFFAAGYKKFLQEVDNARTDKQTGAAPSSQGTTSIVSKGVAAQVLSLATEQGALVRTGSKTTSTFRVNTVGIARLLAGAEQFPYCAIYDYRCESSTARALRGASAGISFYTIPSSNNSSQASSNAGVLGATTRAVAGWNLRYDFHVRRAPREMTKNYQKQFSDKYKDAGADGVAFLKAITKITNPLVLPPSRDNVLVQNEDPNKEYRSWRKEYAEKLQRADAEDFNHILLDALTKLTAIAKKADPNFQSDADDLLLRMSKYFGNRDALLSDYVNKVTFSVEYDNDRPVNQPTQSTAKFIFSARPEGFQFTANASLQWYDQILHSNVSRIRDAQAALQFDRKFGGSNSEISPTVSAGYYFQYMVDNALLTLPATRFAPGTSIPLPGNASELLNTKGAIHLGQLKVTFSIRNSGINFPIALTYSNRTDLIKGTDVRGNFGITYDLDSLFAKK